MINSRVLEVHFHRSAECSRALCRPALSLPAHVQASILAFRLLFASDERVTRKFPRKLEGFPIRFGQGNVRRRDRIIGYSFFEPAPLCKKIGCRIRLIEIPSIVAPIDNMIDVSVPSSEIAALCIWDPCFARCHRGAIGIVNKRRCFR